jgi:hypothetical protein
MSVKRLELEKAVDVLEKVGLVSADEVTCPGCKSAPLTVVADDAGLAALSCDNCDEERIWLRLRGLWQEWADREKKKKRLAGITRPEMLNAVELANRKIRRVPHLVPGVIPRGFNLLAGDPKKGKSLLALDMSLAVASEDRRTMNRLGCEHGEVLYLTLEDSWERVQDRMNQMLAGKPKPPRLTFSLEWPRIDQGGEELLDEWLDQHPEARLIIVDTLELLRPVEKREGSLYRQDYDSVRWFKRIADRRNITVIGVHHLNQTTTKGDGDIFKRISGSAGLIGAADNALVLERLEGENSAVLHYRGRDVGGRLSLYWNDELFQWIASSHVDWGDPGAKPE